MIEQFLQSLLEQGMKQYHGDTELALAWARTRLETFLRDQPENEEQLIEDYLSQMTDMMGQSRSH